jgi:hypothetical protein
MQTPIDVPPAPMTAGALALNCNAQTVSLGVLPPGTYNVTWNYVVSAGIPNSPPIVIETHTFSFSIAAVPALSGPALLGLVLLLGSIGAVILRRQ